MRLVRRCYMVLMREKNREDIVPAPARKTELPPAVVIGRLASHVDHGVDRGAPADHLAARIGELAPIEARLLIRREEPIRARVADGEEVTNGDVEPDPIVVSARFEDENAPGRVSRQ